ncbi:MAG: hypothetical protein ACM3TR_09960 [Caulobacteraceae bacterium]
MGTKTNTQLWAEIKELRALVKQQMEVIEKLKAIIEKYESEG